MPFDGSGNFTRSYNFVQDKTNGIKIVASRMDGEFDNFANAMNQAFLRNGLVPLTGSLNMGTNTINSLGDGTVGTPAVRFNSDPTTGIYVPGYGKVAFTAGGTKRLEANSTGVDVTGALTVSSTLNVGGAATFGSSITAGNIAGVAGTFTGAVSSGGQVSAKSFLATGGVGGEGGKLLLSNNTNTASAALFDVDNANNTRILNYLATNMIFYTNLVERARFDSSGRFGLGQSTPSQLLDLLTSSNDDGILLGNSSANGSRIRMNSTGAGGRNWHINSTANGSGTGGGKFVVRDSSAGDLERLVIDSSGNVGLGVTGPAQKLDVNGSTLVRGNIFITPGSGSWYNGSGSFTTGIASDVGGTNLLFYSASGEKMRLDNSGNFGIGLAPGVKFDVDGRGRFVQDAAPTTGAIVLRQSTGNTWPAYIQWVDNANSTEKGSITIDASSNFTLTAPGANSVFSIGGVSSTHTFAYNESGGEIQLVDSTGAGPVLIDNANGLARFLKVGSGSMSVGTTNTGTLSLQTSNTNRLIFNGSGGITSENRADAVGYKGLPQNVQGGAYTLTMGDQGRHVLMSAGSVVALTIPPNSAVAFPIGTVVTVINDTVFGKTLTQGAGVTLVWGGVATTGNRTLGTGGVASLIKIGTDKWYVNGSGLS